VDADVVADGSRLAAEAVEPGQVDGGAVDWPQLAREWLDEQSRLEALVADLLVLASLDERAPTPSLLVDLDELVLSEARAVHLRARVRVDVTAVTGGRVRGDPVQLRRVVANLLNNAERHATTSIRCTLATSNGTVELTVADDGPGIPVVDRHRVFDRFVRLDESRTPRAGGAGLGLAIVREVVTAHGGTVEVTDTATFAVHLPPAPLERM
jgi:signal transduction histidine kinase